MFFHCVWLVISAVIYCCTVMLMKYAARTVCMHRAPRCALSLRNLCVSAMPRAGNAVKCVHVCGFWSVWIFQHFDDNGEWLLIWVLASKSWRKVNLLFLRSPVVGEERIRPHTCTHTTVLRPFFRDYPGEPVPGGILFWTLWCKGR